MYLFYDKHIAIKASFKEDPIHAHACAHTYTHTLPGDRFPRKSVANKENEMLEIAFEGHDGAHT